MEALTFSLLAPVEQQAPPSAPGPGQVLLRMLAAPVNPSDLNQIQGRYPVQPALPAVAGNEGVARVTALGPDVSDFALGELVLPPVGGFGTWRTHAVAQAAYLTRCPSGLSVPQAATLSVNPLTALRLLADFATLLPGDVVVQNGANGAVGRLVTQMGRERNLRVVSLVRDRPDFQALQEELLALGAASVVRLGHARADAHLASLPPAKLALNAVGGDAAAELARLLEQGGRLVTYGGMSKLPLRLPTSAFIFRGLRAEGFWLTEWTRIAGPQARVRARSRLR
jgi:trans-2-enoyl-CoA reductase